MNLKSNDEIAVIRIELEGIEPLIWRRLGVRTSITLDTLHQAIQTALGWNDRHLWMFTADDSNYGILIPGDDDWNKRIDNAEKITLAMILSGGITELSYVYDFGDGWQHRIVIERIKPVISEIIYPQFLGGEQRCPPEDCGGIPGYNEFIGNVTSKSGQRRKTALDWYGGPYDPDDIDGQQIIQRLNSVRLKSNQDR